MLYSCISAIRILLSFMTEHCLAEITIDQDWGNNKLIPSPHSKTELLI